MTTDVEGMRRYRGRIADAILARRVEIADDWLTRLVDVVQEERRDIFPTATWLDHVPVLIGEIASIVRAGDSAPVMENPTIAAKAIELGELRHRQQASVHQLLREYDLLCLVLERVVRETTIASDEPVAPADCLDVAAEIARVVRSIMQSTVDTFVERYVATIGEQTERLRSLNGFVAHELRTPLQSASLNMEMLLAMRPDDDPERGELEHVSDALERIGVLLGEVERLVQPEETPADDAVRRSVDLAATVRDIGEQYAQALAERDVQLSVDADLGHLVVETGRLALVLSNLIGNAIKYSDPDKEERHVRVQAAPSDEAGRLAVRIVDNGLGIAPALQEKVFELHARAHGALDSAHRVSGHGLGLYLVAEAVREMGGTIALDSEVGRGSVFTLGLPRVAAEPTLSRLDSDDSAKATPGGR